MIWITHRRRDCDDYWTLKRSEDGKELATIKQLWDRYFIIIPGARTGKQRGSKSLDAAKRDAETIVTAIRTMRAGT